MALDDIFERFAEQSPVTVMARAALEHALAPQAIDRLSEETAQRQYTRTLLFSSVVDLMGSVVPRSSPPSTPPTGRPRPSASPCGPSTTSSNVWNRACPPNWSGTRPGP